MKKIVLFLIAFVLLFSCSSVAVTAQTEEYIEVFVTVSDKGKLVVTSERFAVSDKDQDGSFTVNDVLITVHSEKHDGEGYTTAQTEYGLSIMELWGDTSGSYGYYVNNASAWSLLDKVCDGDKVCAFVYSDAVGFSDAYSFFEYESNISEVNKKLVLTLNKLGFDESWNTIVLPVSGAAITVNGENSEYITDDSGKVEIELNKTGEFVISAYSDSEILVPPVLKINVLNSLFEESAQKIYDEIIGYKLKESASKSVQEYIDGTLVKNAGTTAEWYVVSLAQSGEYDFSKYEAALKKYLSENEISSASTRLKYAVALASIGKKNSKEVKRLLNDSIGKQGIMSWVYALHLMNNGVTADEKNVDDVINSILDLQISDGGWALSGTASDVDITAMTVQSLAPYYQDNNSVKTAIDKALSFLSEIQKENACYSSYGVENPESCSQVIVALSCLGIDCTKDERFIKNEKTIFDAIAAFKLDNGAYCHKISGEVNGNATVQVLYATVSYLRYCRGNNGLYIFDKVDDTPEDEEVSEPEVSPPTIDDNGSVGYKFNACIIIAVLLIVTLVVLLLLKKSNKKNLLLLLAAAIILIAIVLLTDFKSETDFSNGFESVNKECIGNVTLCIDCNVIDEKPDHISADGIIFPETKVDLYEDDSVYDLLLRITAKNNIHMETNGSGDMVYVEAIANVYECAYGDLSGWVFWVNGEKPAESCGAVELEDGDVVRWSYSLDLGDELK